MLGCQNQPKEINPDPLKIYEDSVVLEPHQHFYQEVKNPSRGQIEVEVWNSTDSNKTFLIHVEEK